jgi:hypothetical protein
MLSLALSLPVTAKASAEPATKNGAEEAERLFQEGLQQMRSGDYAAACPKLAASFRVDPAPGALFTLAECEAGWKKFATALSHYQAFVNVLTTLSADRRQTFEERRGIAAGQIAVLSVSSPTLTLDVPTHAPPNLVVKVDGVVIAEGSYGVGRKVDPGRYDVTAEIDGRTIWERNVALEQGDQAHVEVSPEKPAPVPLAGVSAAPAPSSIFSSKTLIYVAGGVGVGGFSIGLVAGAFALGKKSTISDNCPALRCNPNGRDAVDSARTDAGISTVGFSLGLVGAAAVGSLLIFAPHSRTPDTSREARPIRSRTRIVSDGRTVSLAGEF